MHKLKVAHAAIEVPDEAWKGQAARFARGDRAVAVIEPRQANSGGRGLLAAAQRHYV
jgi:hypothetical protein